ncbi:putative transposase [Streptomyces bingchenggensis BCW-1]|uniref:Putative transposase n=1 Tax=Streptomyces bingchenggensis (strain BCW-1) TaxID=749414 RepID=D7CE82_STRBB|nr:putative transposase [Streptomyces bingchenggensis BCW-1]
MGASSNARPAVPDSGAAAVAPIHRLHFTPTGPSWLNLVERWFGELTNKRLRRGVHRSVQALERDIRTWIVVVVVVVGSRVSRVRHAAQGFMGGVWLPEGNGGWRHPPSTRRRPGRGAGRRRGFPLSCGRRAVPSWRESPGPRLCGR